MALPPPSAGAAALVTGASSGIGREIARELATRGHGVILVARRRERLEELARDLADRHGVRAEAVPADLADREARTRLLQEVDGLGLDVEVLVNNAGFGIYRPFPDALDRELEQVEVLVAAVVHLNAHVLPAMRERGRGAIINVASTAGFQPLPGNGTYSACKSFALLHSESLAAENKDSGVTVTAVCPGPVATEFQETSRPAFTDHVPKALWCDAERVAADAVSAAEKGKRTIVPGGPSVSAAFAPNRLVPSAISLPVSRRLFSKELKRDDRA